MRLRLAFLILAACTPAPSTTAPPVTPRTPEPVKITEAPKPEPEKEESCGAFEEPGDEDAGYFVADRQSTWEPGSTLNVIFLDGQPEWRKKVAEVAREWEQYANIHFAFEPKDFDPSKQAAEVRITFKGPGYWSAIGSTSLNRPAERASMNFHFPLMSKGDLEIHRVVMHEFGHSLGLWHEHQNPNLKVTWNKEVLYEYYQRVMGWDKARVDSQVLTPLSLDRVDAKPFDPKSIMLYPILPEFTAEHLTVERNMVVSDLDKKYIGELYPGKVAPTKPDETMAAAKQVKFSFVQIGDNRYRAAVDAPADVLAKIERATYQRQGVDKKFIIGRTVEDRFAFEWSAKEVVPVKLRIVWKTGVITSATYDKKPTDVRGKKPIDWKAEKAKIAFAFTTANGDGKWATYSVALNAGNAKLVASIAYTRQHETFPEFRANKAIVSNAVAKGFGFTWRGYGWVPVKAIVTFTDGSTQDYTIAGPPT